MISPFFSIIIPVYNVEKYLKKCIDSILCQSFKNYEIIIVDDGSTDNSPFICDSYKDNENIIVIHKENGGQASARNIALDLAKGLYVMFVDSDDYWNDIDGLKNIFNRIEKHGNDVVLFGGTQQDLVTGIHISYRNNYELSIFNKNKTEILDYLYKSGKFPSSSWIMAVKKSLIENNELRFPEGVTAEDVIWVNNIMVLCHSLGAINDVLYVYVQNRPGQTTSRKLKSGIDGYVLAFKDWEKGDKADVYPPITQRMAHIYMAMLMFYSCLNKKDRKEVRSKVIDCSYILKKSNKIGYKFLKLIIASFGAFLPGWGIAKLYSGKKKIKSLIFK